VKLGNADATTLAVVDCRMERRESDIVDLGRRRGDDAAYLKRLASEPTN